MANRQITIHWVQPDIKVVADLLDDLNPKMCDVLWNYLPYRSVQLHALISNEHLYHYNPIVESMFLEAEYMESRATAPVGTVFLSYLQHLSMKYGLVTEDLPAAPVARVRKEDLAALAEAGRRCWDATYQTKEVIEVRVERVEDVEMERSFHSTSFPEVASNRVNALISEIQDAISVMWTTPPDEVVKIHRGDIATRAGSYDQYYSTMVFVNGEERALGYNALGGLLKSCVNSQITLPALREITKNFVSIPAEFLEYCGLTTLGSFCSRAIELLDDLESKEEYATLFSALTVYGNIINGWNLHYFPWRHGDEHKFETGRISVTA
ncbi:cucumopine synthase-related protein [Streptomyces chartreusis]|uniref:cucumopine synthase-related protein n=1 Tax=Streptomyces chartreusis TaxID=1969 RepID=UPI00369676DB